MNSAAPHLWAAAGLLLVSLAPGCGGAEPEPEPPAPQDDDDSEESLGSLWPQVYAVLDFRCTCHTAPEGNRGGFGGLDTQDSAYQNIVGQPSRDIPEMNRVEPFAPELSYLLHKIEGRAVSVGGDGSRMPPTGRALQPDDKELIRLWIEEGAPEE
jgi:hypothetical protein